MKTKDDFIKYTLIPLTILAALVFWVYWLTLTKLINYLISNDDYSYGLLIPIVSCYIIFQKWPQIQQTTWQPSWWGLPSLFVGYGLIYSGS